MLFTLAHELTHDIKQSSPEQYETLKTVLLEAFVKDGQDLLEMIDSKKAREEGLTDEGALEEVVADAMESMLTDGTVLEALAEIKKKDKGLWQKIVDFFKDFAEDLKKMAEAYRDRSAQTNEGRLVQQMAEVRKQLQDIYTKALAEDAVVSDGQMAAQVRDEKTAPGGGKSEKQVQLQNRNTETVEKYSYEFFVSKPDMKVSFVDTTKVPTSREGIVEKAKRNVASVGKPGKTPGSITVYVEDIRKDIVVGKKGLEHGLDRRKFENAPVTCIAGDILENSIRINELNPAKDNASSTDVLIGVAENEKGELYVVRSVVNSFSSNLMSMDVLYAINAKKEGPAALNAPLLSRADYRATISIENLLALVNKNFADVLPEYVLRHFGYDARPEGELGKSALYQLREGASNRELLAGALETVAQTDMERERLEEYRGKIADIDELERELTTANKEIRSMIKGDIPYSRERMLELRTQANAAANRIDIADRQLLRLEATAPMKAVLERQRKAEQKKTTKRVEACICQEKVDT